MLQKEMLKKLPIFFNAFFRTLCVSNCMLVTDQGILWFCGQVKENTGVCRGGLENLFIRGTSVTTSGVSDAVCLLHELKHVDYDEVVPACVRGGIVRPRSNLLSFSCGADGSLVIETLVTLSPDSSVKCTRIEEKVYTNQIASMVDLSSILSPPMQTGEPNISFILGVVPFLTRFGYSLRNLSLDNISDVDVFFITFTCPLLKSIKFKRCRFIALPARNIPRSFIEDIEYDGSVGGQITGRALLHFFLSPKLTSISLIYAQRLSDRILNFAFSKHGFQHLKRLKLFACHGISNEAFKSAFLVDSNVLQCINIWECLKLSSKNVRDEWRELARTKNWDVQIDFF